MGKSSRKLLVATVVAFGVIGTPAEAQSLREALAETYKSNPEISAQRASLKSSAELIPQALSSWFRPDVTATVTGTGAREYYKETKRGTSNLHYDYSEKSRDVTSEVELSMDLYNGGGSAADIRYARAAYLVARATLEQTEQTVLARAATRYLDVVRAKQYLAQAQAHAEGLKAVLQRVEALLANQRATVSDRAEVALEIATAKASVETRSTTLRSARSAFQETVGTDPGDLTDWPDLPETTTELEALLEVAVRQNPEIVGAQAEVDSRQAQLESDRADLLPTVTFYATATQEDNKGWLEGSSDLTDRTRLTNYSVALELSIPLYGGGERSSTIRASRMDVSESRLKLSNSHRSVEDSIRDAWFRFHGAEAAIDRVKERLENAKILQEGREREFQRHVTTVDIVVDAHVAVQAASEALIEQEYARRVAIVDLLVAEGLFGVTHLALDVTPIDIDGYARRVEENSWIPWDMYKPEAD